MVLSFVLAWLTLAEPAADLGWGYAVLYNARVTIQRAERHLHMAAPTVQRWRLPRR
jgi:hypothetical protein